MIYNQGFSLYLLYCLFSRSNDGIIQFLVWQEAEVKYCVVQGANPKKFLNDFLRFFGVWGYPHPTCFGVSSAYVLRNYSWQALGTILDVRV